MQWNLFAALFDQVGPPVVGSVDAMISVLQAWVRPVLLAGLLLYVPGRLMWASVRGNVGNPFGDLEANLIAGAIFLYMATEAAAYGPYVRNVLLNGVSTEVGRALVGSLGNRPISGALFDEVWNRAWVSGLAAFRNLPWSMAGFGLSIVVVVYWFVSIVGILVAFIVWLSSYVMCALLVGMGPLFIGLFAFPWTRGIAWGWLRTTLANVVLQVFAVALLTLVLGAMTRILAQLYATTGIGGVRNEITQLQMLMGGVVVFLACGWLAYQLPGAAAAITHGFTGFGHMPSGFGFGRGDGAAPPADQTASGGPQQQGAAPPPAPAAPATQSIPRNTPPGRSLG